MSPAIDPRSSRHARPAVQIHLGAVHIVIETVRLPPRWLWGSIIGAAASALSAWSLAR
jgi:hypothetical protein